MNIVVLDVHTHLPIYL